MVKLLHKKDISTEESPIMLQRRHTIMEVDKDCTLMEPKLKSIIRSNSTNSLNQTKSKHSEENANKKTADTTLSPEGSISVSNASTVVITESELSSSWLYNNKKAQMKTPSPSKTSSRVAEMNDEIRSPMLPKSTMRSNSMVSGRPKTSSCCCYALIILIIVLAALGILAAIASILYMEFFASYNVTDIQISTVKPISQENIPLKKVGHLLAEEIQKTLDGTKLPGRASESVLFPDSSAKDKEKMILSEKPSSSRDIAAVDKNKSLTVNETDSSSSIIEDLLNITSQMINSVTTDQKGISNPINALLSRNQNLESHYSKLFELYQGLRTSGSSVEKSVEPEHFEQTPQTTGVSNTSISGIKDLNSMQISDDKISNIQVKADFNFPKISSDVEETSSDSAKDSSKVEKNASRDSSVVSETKYFFGVSDVDRDSSVVEDISTDLPVVDEDLTHFRLNIIEGKSLKDFLNMPLSNPSKELEHIPKEIEEFNKLEAIPDDSEKMETLSHKQLPQTPEDNLRIPNSFRTLDIDFEDKINEEQSKVSDPNQPLANLPIMGTTRTLNFIPKFLSQLDRTRGISNSLRNLDDSQSNAHKEETSVSAAETDSVDWNRPVLETNIAVPRPVEMINNFGKEDNEKNDQAGLIQLDRQFSLAKALERLRLLDANDILQSSRQKSKTVSQKKQEEPKILTHQEVATERSRYLENLRKRFFDG